MKRASGIKRPFIALSLERETAIALKDEPFRKLVEALASRLGESHYAITQAVEVTLLQIVDEAMDNLASYATTGSKAYETLVEVELLKAWLRLFTEDGEEVPSR